MNDKEIRQNRSRGLPVLHYLGGNAYWFLFCIFLSPFRMTEFVITEKLLSSLIFKTLVSLH